MAAARLEAATLVAEAHQRRTALEARRARSRVRRGAWRSDGATELAAARIVAPVLPLVAEVARLQSELDGTRAAIAATSGDLARAMAGSGSRAGDRALAGGRRAHRCRPRAPQRGCRATSPRQGRGRGPPARRGGAQPREPHRRARRAGPGTARPARRSSPDAASGAHRGPRPECRGDCRRCPAVVAELAHADERLRRRPAPATGSSTTAAGWPTGSAPASTPSCAARAAWLDLRQARLDGMAAELAAGLTEDLPCPVCGGTEHPRTAQPGPRAVTKAAEDRAAAQARAAERAREEARQELAQVEAELAAATARAGGTDAAADLESARDLLAGRVGELTGLAATAAADAAAFDAFAEQHESWLRDSVALDEEARSVRQRIDEDQGRLGRLRARPRRRPRRRPDDRRSRAAAGPRRRRRRGPGSAGRGRAAARRGGGAPRWSGPRRPRPIAGSAPSRTSSATTVTTR